MGFPTQCRHHDRHRRNGRERNEQQQVGYDYFPIHVPGAEEHVLVFGQVPETVVIPAREQGDAPEDGQRRQDHDHGGYVF